MKLLCNIDWTAVSAVFGIVIAFLSFKQVRNSLKARLIFCIKQYEGVFCIEIKNVGHYPAQQIKPEFNDEFKKILQNDIARLKYCEMKNRGFRLNGGDSKLCPICQIEGNREIVNQTQITIRGNYKDTYTNRVRKINEEFMGNDFMADAALEILNYPKKIFEQITNSCQKKVKND